MPLLALMEIRSLVDTCEHRYPSLGLTHMASDMKLVLSLFFLMEAGSWLTLPFSSCQSASRFIFEGIDWILTQLWSSAEKWGLRISCIKWP